MTCVLYLPPVKATIIILLLVFFQMEHISNHHCPLMPIKYHRHQCITHMFPLKKKSFILGMLLLYENVISSLKVKALDLNCLPFLIF